MERVQFLEHLSQRILSVDCRDCGPTELVEIFDQVRETVAGQPPQSVLILTDFTGADFDKAAADQLKIVATYNRGNVKRSAFVGTEDLPDVYYRNLKSFSARDFPVFKTRGEALDWRVSDRAQRAAG